MVCFTIGYTWAFLQGFSRCCRGRGLGCCTKYHMGHSRTIPFFLHIQVHQLRACWRLHSGFPPPSRSWSEETCCSGPPATCFPALQRLVFEGDPHSAAIRGDQLLLFLPVYLIFPTCSSGNASCIFYQKSLRSRAKGGFPSENPNPVIYQTRSLGIIKAHSSVLKAKSEKY